MEGLFNGGFFPLPVWGGSYIEGLILEFYGASNGSVDFKKTALITSKIERPH